MSACRLLLRIAHDKAHGTMTQTYAGSLLGAIMHRFEFAIKSVEFA
jgi:hypothetical protein